MCILHFRQCNVQCIPTGQLFRIARTLSVYVFLFAKGACSQRYKQQRSDAADVEQYEAAAMQFRNDVAVNPSDTEEAIWAFLAEAKLLGAPQARRQFLQVPRRGHLLPQLFLKSETSHAAKWRCEKALTGLAGGKGFQRRDASSIHCLPGWQRPSKDPTSCRRWKGQWQCLLCQSGEWSHRQCIAAATALHADGLPCSDAD